MHKTVLWTVREMHVKIWKWIGILVGELRIVMIYGNEFVVCFASMSVCVVDKMKDSYSFYILDEYVCWKYGRRIFADNFGLNFFILFFCSVLFDWGSPE